MWLWWEKRAELVDYFLLHHVFEMLYHLDDDFRAEWEKGLRLSSRPPHALQVAMLFPFDAETFDAFMRDAFVHKLRHKYKPHHVSSDSYLAHVIRGDVGPGGPLADGRHFHFLPRMTRAAVRLFRCCSPPRKRRGRRPS